MPGLPATTCRPGCQSQALPVTAITIDVPPRPRSVPDEANEAMEGGGEMTDNELTKALEEVLASFSSEVDEGLTEREYELARVTVAW
jgi:hypothetical protein